ncbi:MAG: hypothetical protein BWK72_19385 [Rhodoferax ferrireducens]|uniref:Ice-binding protein C-terminal domain-containing protein n=1 Tax=Rhodoferax ferrireducens TaxID=192843 RepID=A0A1W9KPH1_9BURK|nr:MAG: hypothetical protein BWK72_19385 [Rhodoferax ferrireducens]
MTSIRTLIAAAALCVAGTAPAFAQSTTFTNGDFSNRLIGWSTLGDVSTTGGSNPTAVLTTAYVDPAGLLSSEFPNFSGVPAALIDEVEAFAGLTSGTLGLDAAEGSVLQQSFDVLAGDSITLDFSFGLATVETDLSAFNDFAFVAVNGVMEKVVSLTDASRTGSFSYQFATGGKALLSFGVVDINDINGVSVFVVDNVQVTPVPEPESYAMLLAGLALMGGIARRRSQG